MEIIKRDLFDVAIERKEDATEVDFYFDILKVNEDKSSAEVDQNGDYINVPVTLHGRIVIGYDSYFAEIAGYVHPNHRGRLTYHLLLVDKKFKKKYQLNTSDSGFQDYESFHLL